MDLEQLLAWVVRPTLKALGAHSLAAEQLIMGTITQESGGKYIRQLGNGPARGIVQMEPNTHYDLWKNYILYRRELADKLFNMASSGATFERAYPLADELVFNLKYAVAMARVHYLRQPEALPKYGDIVGMACYWKKHYNTPQGKGTTSEFLEQFPYELFQLPRVESSMRESRKE